MDVTRGSLADPPSSSQQVMSPSGEAAQVPDRGRHRTDLPNGAPRHVGGTLEDDAAYEQALRASGLGATDETTGQGTTRDDGGMPGTSGGAEGVQTAVEAGNAEVFQSPTTMSTGPQDRLLLPHAAAISGTNRGVRPTDVPGDLFPSPMPSPLTQQQQGNESSALGGGLNLAQHSMQCDGFQGWESLCSEGWLSKPVLVWRQL